MRVGQQAPNRTLNDRSLFPQFNKYVHWRSARAPAIALGGTEQRSKSLEKRRAGTQSTLSGVVISVYVLPSSKGWRREAISRTSLSILDTAYLGAFVSRLKERCL